MRAVSLMVVFVMAKAAVLSGHTLPVSPWTPFAYLWQDALVALLFGLVEWRLPSRVAWVTYWAIAMYSALNIPVGRALSTPLTWPMLRAARGPLADSITLYITWQNVLWMGLTLGVGAVLPFVFRRVTWKAAAGALAFIAVGVVTTNRVDTMGLERNAVAVLFAGGVPRLTSNTTRGEQGDWRASPFPQNRADDLARLRGIAKGRNVIMVSLESTAAQYLSLYGGEYDLTPNLSALARQGIVFDNAYAAYPESIKGLFSVLCSTFPAFDSKTEAYADVPCRPIPGVLAEAGYSTALFHSGRFGYLGMEAIIHNRGYQTLEDAGDIGGNHESSFGVDEPATVARMLAWIDRLPPDQRFFLTYLPIAGHHPYETPERGPFPERDEIGRYRNSLLYGDASLGTLIEGLRARGLAENTLWVVFGDHGEAFGQHEGNYGHTFFLYEENIHVPLVIAAPGAIEKQVRSREVVSLVDLAPTVLDFLGMTAPEGYQGKTALDGSPRMALFFADYSLGFLGLRDGRYKFIYDLGSGRSRMFDLEADPGETRDVSAEVRRAGWYSESLRRWSGAQKTYLARGR